MCVTRTPLPPNAPLQLQLQAALEAISVSIDERWVDISLDVAHTNKKQKK